MIARTYLSMRQYDSAGKYANLCLQLKNSLLDYNNSPPLDPNISFPFGNNLLQYNNPEIIYECRMSVPPMLNAIRAKIDSELYQSYAVDDLRKFVFFKDNGDGTHSFKGSYEGNANLFTGIAVDEVYLVRAECYARTGNLSAAMNDLNTLLLKRWKTGTFIPLSATSLSDALKKILDERRKELVMRGLRWIDIKRLNKEGANISLSRLINGQLITLPPNDLRYALAIPEDIIRLSGMPQNGR
jgi:hypothetical protein